jgi:hydrogenase expression/formation protein HypC
MCLGIPATVVELDGSQPDLATVEIDGVRRSVNVGLLAEQGVGPGDWVLVHVGFAMAKLDEQEARATLAALDAVGQAFADEVAAFSQSRIE